MACSLHTPDNYHWAPGQKVRTARRIMALLCAGYALAGGLSARARIAWAKGVGMCDWKRNEQVKKASIVGWLETGTLISCNRDCKISGEESVKALESEAKWFGGVERRMKKYMSSTITMIISVLITEPHGICQSWGEMILQKWNKS